MATFEKVGKNTQEYMHIPEDKTERKPGIESEQELEDLGEKRIANLSLKQEELGGENKINNSLGVSPENYDGLLQKSGAREKLKALSEQGQQYLSEATAKISEVAQTKEFNQIADATPFVGGVKRVAESVYGKTLSGEELSGKDRLIHGAKGAVDLGLDFTGIGEVEKGAKMAYVGKKIATGLKDNPETLTNLGKKIIHGKEKVADGNKDAEIDFSKDEQIENILSKKEPEKTDLNFEGSKEKWANEEKQEAETSQENLRYREKITNPEALKIIDENSEKVRQELKEVEKNVGDKLSNRDEKIKAKKDEMETFLKGRDVALKDKKFLEEEIPRQESYINGIMEDIREREKKIQELENQGVLGKFKNRDQIKKLKNEANGLAEYSYNKEKNKLGEYTNKLAETNNKLENDFSLKKASSQLEKAYDEWQRNLSYGGMTEANPEYQEKLDDVANKQLEFYEKNDLKREGLDKESILEEYRNIAGSLVYGIGSGNKMDVLRGKSLDKIPSMDASTFAIGMKQEDVEVFLKSQEKLKGSVSENDMLTQKDFDIARNRAYYEARRTAQNVYTHVMFPDAIKKVISDHALRSSLNIKNSGDAKYGIQRNEEAVYVTHGGGGYKNYGGKDFAFFAASGSDILSHDRSLSVATPGLKEKGEAALGRQVAEFESDNGADMPVENMVFCCSERQVEDYKKLFLENGYNEEWVNKSVKGIPDDIHSKMYEEDESSWNVHNKRHEQMPENENFMNSVVKSSLRDKKAFDDKIYATVASRKSRDNNTKIHKWVAIN